MNKKNICPRCSNYVLISGKIPDGRKVIYCKICKYRGIADNMIIGEKLKNEIKKS